MFCPNCGGRNPEGTRFCQRCGNQFPQNTGYPAQGGPPQNAVPGGPPRNAATGPSNPAGPVPGQGFVPNQGGAPNAGFQPPNAGYPPQNRGVSPNAGYPPPNAGYQPPNQGFGANMGYRPSGPGFNQVPQGGPYIPKKKNTGLIAAIIALVLVVILVPVILSSIGGDPDKPVLSSPSIAASPSVTGPAPTSIVAADGFRNNFTKILGGGRDKVTVMVYICGSDLESEDGCATLDIKEMLAADLGDNVNVVLETGGSKSWSTPGIKDGQVQRWVLEDGRLKELANLGQKGMLNSDALSDFVSFAASKYPANRYSLVFWDHGGGSLRGYGKDQVVPKTVLFLPDIAKALKKSGVKFDFVGFDACLMGSIETAYMLEPYADYLIGSEETEPAFGWNYTPWLSAVAKNPSIDTVELGKVVVDSYMEANARSKKAVDNTLSVVALREIPFVYDKLCEYMSTATTALANKEFKMISTALSNTKAFAEGDDFDLIDIGDFVKRANLTGKDKLTSALSSAVKYNKSTARTGVYGLSIYFPYKDLKNYSYAKQIFAQISFGDEIYKFYDKFVNILAGGQKNSDSRSLKENLTGQADTQTDYSSFSWYNSSDVSSYTYDDIQYAELKVQKDASTGNWYLPLTEDDWSLLTDVQMQILYDDGKGYIDLGSDQYFETDDNDNLLLNYGSDRTWLAIGGQTVCYYAESAEEKDDGSYVFTGYVPAVLNGEKDIELIVQRDSVTSGGTIAGYRLVEEDSSVSGGDTLGKGYKQLKNGDKIDFVCDYYTYDGKYDDQYYFGDSMTIGSTPPAVTYEDVGNNRVLECYMLVDIYQNESWTETVEFPAEK